MLLSIVIAVYNEEDNIKELTHRIYDSMSSLKIPFELIYAIDGTDRSFDILMEIKKTKKNLILDHSPKLRGFKNAFVSGFNLVNKKATHILTMDGDLNHQPEEIKNFINAINGTGSDIIVGSRFIKEGKMERVALWKRCISIFANFVIKLIWNINIKDKTSGFRLYKKEVIDKVIPFCKSEGFEFLLEILIIAKKLGYKIMETPIIFKARKYGESKFELWKTMKGYIDMAFKHL